MMMKLKLLVVAAALMALPAMGHAQAMSKDSMMMKDSMKMSKPMKKHTMKKAEMAMPMASTGTDCPMKCPTSKGAAGLSGTQFLALQQELRDRGCGNAHVTGWLDAETRHAIATCAKKMNVKNNAAAVLVAMNIGYSDADVTPAKTE
jgi:hypothetical protein